MSATANPVDETVAGTLEIMLGKGEAAGAGMDRVLLSAQTFVLSFVAVGLMLLIDATVHSMNYSLQAANGKELVLGRIAYVVLSSMATTVGYVAFVVLLFIACRLLDLRQRFEVSLLVHNWSGAIVSALFLPVAALYALTSRGGDPSPFWNLAMLLVFSFVVVAGLRVTRVTLGCTTGQSVAVFMLSGLASLVATHAAETMLGLA
ncbi:hypothetical protein N9H93_02330 [Rhizobiaceae bacterium]|nr:hypothetical protein [Rhizobiaceae bacterium]